jgi:CMP/dCMP kinase
LSLPNTIAIDGSAASGKSTLGQRLARRLAYLYVDTGAMYRAITWAAHERHISIDDETALSALAENLEIELKPAEVDDGRQYTVLVNTMDVTWQLRSPAIDADVARVSSFPGVRAAAIRQQRRIGRRGRIIMVGRDIGTVVLPEADLKLFVDASAEERARRRYHECRERGETVDYEAVLDSMRQRDKIDREKPISPMIPAPDAILINTDGRTAAEVFAQVERLLFAANEVA